MGDDLFYQVFNVDYLRDLLVLTIGIPIGLGVGLGVNRLWDWCHVQPAARKERVDKQLRILGALRAAIERNDKLLASVGHLFKAQAGFLPWALELQVLDATAAVKWELLDNKTICGQVDIARHALTNLQKRLDIITAMECNPAVNRADRRHLADCLENVYPRCVTMCQTLLNELNQEIHRLSTSA